MVEFPKLKVDIREKLGTKGNLRTILKNQAAS
jgi:hypothetical protein